MNHEVFEVNDQLGYGGLLVGDMLELLKRNTHIEELKNSQRLEVVGFLRQTEIAETKIIIQIDNKFCCSVLSETFSEFFRITRKTNRT